MSEVATFKFRAKRMSNVARWAADGRSWTDGHTAYRVPVLRERHCTTPRAAQVVRHAMLFNSPADRRAAEYRQRRFMRAAGLDGVFIYAEDAADHSDVVTISPIGSGFMADITIRVDLAAK